MSWFISNPFPLKKTKQQQKYTCCDFQRGILDVECFCHYSLYPLTFSKLQLMYFLHFNPLCKLSCSTLILMLSIKYFLLCLLILTLQVVSHFKLILLIWIPLIFKVNKLQFLSVYILNIFCVCFQLGCDLLSRSQKFKLSSFSFLLCIETKKQMRTSHLDFSPTLTW